MTVLKSWVRTKTVICVLSILMAIVLQVTSLSGPNVCTVKQKYNITKRVKYRAPMSVRTYEWCFSMPPRCSRWKTEMRDLTRLETQERTADVTVCCPGYKMKEVSCVPICPNGKTGNKCSEECPPNKWGPNCVNNCKKCLKGTCSPITGDCECLEGWQGESCNIRMTTQPPPALMEEILTTTKSTLQTLPPFTKTVATTKTVSLESTTPVTYNSPISTKYATTLKTEEMTTSTKTTMIVANDAYSNVALPSTTAGAPMSIDTTQTVPTTFVYNRTETPTEGTSTNLTSAHVTSVSKSPLTTKTIRNIFITTPISSTIYSTSTPALTTLNEISTTTEAVKKIETNTKFLNVSKFKPKEIWIKPTQKGISTEFKLKISPNHERIPIRNGSKNDSSSEITTPRTIIVSIIPTSVSHASFKKIALTTATHIARNTKTQKTYNQSVETGFTRSMAATPTQAPFTIKILTTRQRNLSTMTPIIKNVTKTMIPKTSSKKALTKISPAAKPSNITKVAFTTSTLKNKSTNSMTNLAITNQKSFYSTNAIALQTSTSNVSEITTRATINLKDERKFLKDEIFRTPETTHETTTKRSKTTNITEQVKTTILVKIPPKKTNLRNTTKTIPNTITTESPSEDETFHILTEPEHITAVMTDKEREKNSLDLISVVSVVGGIMMAVITVAVIIVMFERCRRPRYDDIRKIHDIQMRAMMGNDDPPPYVRSIFHTPLPEPPRSEKCHYQPISTLDRNLKQFMRPVVVQNISPIMLENFRGILECHYDHLPQRSLEVSARSSIAPSINHEEQHSHRTLAEYTIDALKCEAKLDIIDSTNAEPLYAEIPCWRPPSEHAVEVMNLNGEAVTEL
ncbi:unnamed protein product [Pieris macdunnoughi]|uniref:EMI domain-containing protein n=1 Tax=Pieris macdunnoughi TaxID=345717 RepID=A0A821Q1S6_9NEOP|nr:unnamed protein product [Pieris macdunnoughi]